MLATIMSVISARRLRGSLTQPEAMTTLIVSPTHELHTD